VEDAIRHLQRANALRAGQQEVMLSLVDALIAVGRTSEGEKLGLEAIGRNPSFVPLYELMHRHYRAVRREKEAKEILEMRIRNNPSDSDALVRLCEYYRSARPAAIAGCIERLTSQSRSGARLLKAGDFLRRAGDLAGAIEQYSRGAGLEGNTRVEHVTRLVETLVGAGRVSEAKSRVEKLYLEAPGNPTWKRMKAELSLDGTPDEVNRSIATLEAMAGDFPRDPALWHALGRAYQSKKEYGKAAKHFEKATSVDPSHQSSRIAIAEMLMSTGKHRDALTRIRVAREVDPGDSKLRLLESSALTALGEFDKADAVIGDLLEERPGNVEAAIQRAYILLGRGEVQKAEAAFAGLGSRTSDPRVPLGLAQTLAASNRAEAALRVLETSGLGKASDVERFRAGMLVRLGRHDEAIAIYKELIAKQPDAELMAHLGEAQMARGDGAAAEASFTRAEQLSDGGVIGSMGIALIKVSRGDHRGAIEAYRKVLAKEPRNAVAMNNLAFEIAEYGGDLEEALTLAARATEIEPAIDDFNDTFGWVYLKKNQPAEARKRFETIVRKSPKNPTYRYHLGAAFAAEGSNLRARAELTAALGLRPSPDEVRKIEALLRRVR
jgi:tetratricopeptide (TPR) repeat protein